METSKHYLRGIREHYKIIHHLSEQCDTLRFSLGASAIRYDKDNIQTSIEDTMTAKLAELGDFEQKRKELLKTLSARQAQAIEIISRIPDTKQRQVMEIYYFDTSNPTWDDVADEMGYDRRYILKVHGNALGWINDHVSIK